MKDNAHHSAVVKQLRARLREMQRAAAPAAGANGVSSTGVEALDGLLAPAVFRPGMVVEWIASGTGSGAARLAAAMAVQALNAGGALVVVDDRREFYPPAAVRLGLDLERTIVVRPRSRRETVWALEQALRCRGVAATLAWIWKLPDRLFRRLQLAAEHGAGLGMFMRPVEALRTPSWADLRWLVQAAPGGGHEEAIAMEVGFTEAALNNGKDPSGRRVRVELVHCREGTPGEAVELEIDDETGAVRVVSPLAAAARVFRAAGA
ncbi:MAG: hypothetical protein HY290_05470 [Planctomycetia bacterium]|nr:hypothetical protein [Planctomycetia bacterium]